MENSYNNMTDDYDSSYLSRTYDFFWDVMIILVIAIIALVCIFYVIITWSLQRSGNHDEDNDTLTESSSVTRTPPTSP